MRGRADGRVRLGISDADRAQGDGDEARDPCARPARRAEPARVQGDQGRRALAPALSRRQRATKAVAMKEMTKIQAANHVKGYRRRWDWTVLEAVIFVIAVGCAVGACVTFLVHV